MSLSTFIDSNKTDSGIILPDGHAKVTLASWRVNTLLNSKLFTLHSKVATQGYVTRTDLEDLIETFVTDPEFAHQASKIFRLDLDGWWIALQITTTKKSNYHVVVGKLDWSEDWWEGTEVNLNKMYSELYNHLFVFLCDYKLKKFKQIEEDSDAANNAILQLIQNATSQSGKSKQQSINV